MNNRKNILIVGGGFGGVSVALEMSRLSKDDVEITLISDKSHFEYHGALYRLVTGRSPLEICIPLYEIFLGTNIKIIKDKISNVDVKKSICVSESGDEYPYDYLVMAVGSETSYLGIPGLKKNSFGFKSISEAMELKNHLHKQFERAASDTKNDTHTHMVVVGGGASGVELAAELMEYGKVLAISHEVDVSRVEVDLIHSRSRLISDLPKEMGERVYDRLVSMGVSVHLNKRLTKEEIETVYMGDDQISSRTLVWTAGVETHPLHTNMHRFSFTNKKKVKVDKYLRAVGHKNIFVIGDNASSKYVGMAQTAIFQGFLAAKNIMNLIDGSRMRKYDAVKPVYAIPLGRNWAATQVRGITYYGYVGWILRRYLDLKVFRVFLPFRKAWRAFLSGHQVCETCPECAVV